MDAHQAWEYIQSGEGIGVTVIGRKLECFRVDMHTVECDKPDDPGIAIDLDQAGFLDMFGRFSFKPVQVEDMV